MLSRSTWLHLRIPFSYFLLPIYLFAVSISPNLDASRIFWTFIILHFFLYPASNGYNSYFDKDEKSIGGLKNPPPVKKELYYTALGLDLIAIALGLIFINFSFALMLFIYGLISKMYSHPAIRLKKYALGGWLVTGFFQGLFTLGMCYLAINNYGLGNLAETKVLLAGGLTSVMLWGNYPMTQVYQHEEDARHHDRTMSIMLGIRGTFVFAQIVFGLAVVGFFMFFKYYYKIYYSYVLLIALLPVLCFFAYWFFRVCKSSINANFTNTMWLNFISATCLNIFFVYFFLSSSHWLG